MKRTIAVVQEVQGLAGQMENTLMEIEELTVELGRRWQGMMELGADLLTKAENGPMYVQERSRRLQEVMKILSGKQEKIRENYTAVSRNLGRIKDSDLVEYFSPALQKRVDSLVEGGYVRDEFSTSNKGFIVFRLQGTNYIAEGKPSRIFKHVGFVPPSRLRIRRGALHVFPEITEDIGRPIHLLLFRRGANVYALWCDEIIDVPDLTWDLIQDQTLPMQHPHRFIEGRVYFRGEYYFRFSF